MGLDGVQVTVSQVADDLHLYKPEVQQTYLASARLTGVEIASLALRQLRQTPLKSGDPRVAQWLIDSIDVCKALGVKNVMAFNKSRGIKAAFVLERGRERNTPRSVIVVARQM